MATPLRPSIRPVPISPSLNLKPPRQAFEAPARKTTFVDIRHPGYPDGRNTLFLLPAYDSNGLHHVTARVACAILANNSWDGYFSLTRDGPVVNLGNDDILVSDTPYYFIVPTDANYAIVPSFAHYVFPSTLPYPWRAPSHPPIGPSGTDRVLVRDKVCRITASHFPLDISHIIPVKQAEWWLTNSMFRHAAEPALSMATDCSDNALLLRKDVHHLWDDHKFAIVPKKNKWACHVLANPPTTELRDKYHNLETQPLAGVALEFLFARFALAVFNYLNVFLQAGVERTLVLVAEGRQETKKVVKPECARQFGVGPKSRSQSPRKKRAASSNAGDGGGVVAEDVHEEWMAEQEGREVKRRRLGGDDDYGGIRAWDWGRVLVEERRGRSRTSRGSIKSEPLSPNGGGPWSAQTSFTDLHESEKVAATAGAAKLVEAPTGSLPPPFPPSLPL